VVAVPNARALVAEASALERSAAAAPPPATPVDDLRARAAAALAAVWPVEAGPRVGWHLELSASDSVLLSVTHVGPSLGAAGAALLGRAVEDRLRAPVRMQTVALPASPLVATAGRERAWVDSAQKILTAVAATDSAVACLHAPIGARRRHSSEERTAIAGLQSSQAARPGRVTIADAPRFDIRVAVGACAPALPSAVAPAGASTAATPPMRASPGVPASAPPAR
jgi:hypothetical protein